MNDLLKNIIKQFMPFAQKQIGFKDPPRLFLRNDSENAKNPLGKTAFYDPVQKSITLYVTGRHPKDILRSLGHELVHHKQNCAGQFSDSDDMGEGYAQRDPHLRQMELEANRDGSMCLRDFEDMLKKENTIYYEHLQKGDKKMSTKDWKNKEITQLLSEAWGFKFNNLEEFEEFNGTGELQTEEEGEIEELARAKQAGDRRKPHKRTPVEDDDDKELDESAEEVNEDEIEEGMLGAIGGGLMGGPVGAIAGHYAQKAADKSLETAKRDDDEDEDTDEEAIEEIAPLAAAGLGAAGAMMAGKRDEEDEEELEEDGFAPNHYCVHHGGVKREGKVEMAEAIGHNFNEELGQVTHYDMKFEDGTIMEGVPFEDIQVTNASLAEEHGGHKTGKRDDDETVEENETVDKLKEAIANLLRKHLRD